MVLFAVAVSPNFRSRACFHGGQNEHRRELRDSMREDNEFGDVTLVQDSDTEIEARCRVLGEQK